MGEPLALGVSEQSEDSKRQVRMQKAHCHDQEYWLVRRTQCNCGTAYSRTSVGAQRFEQRPTGPVDVLVLRCEHCGTESELEFDISSFFGKVEPSSFEELLRDKERAWRMYMGDQLRMEAVVQYLSELAKHGDSLAIEYSRGCGPPFPNEGPFDCGGRAYMSGGA